MMKGVGFEVGALTYRIVGCNTRGFRIFGFWVCVVELCVYARVGVGYFDFMR